MTAQNRRMKKIIKAAFIELLEHKPINKITKEMICAKADIGHSTFYRYYQDKYNLAQKIIEDIVEEYFDISDEYLQSDYDLYLQKTYELFEAERKPLQLLYKTSVEYFDINKTLYYYIRNRFFNPDNTFSGYFISTYHLGVILYCTTREQLSAKTMKKEITDSIFKGASHILNIGEDELKKIIQQYRNRTEEEDNN